MDAIVYYLNNLGVTPEGTPMPAEPVYEEDVEYSKRCNRYFDAFFGDDAQSWRKYDMAGDDVDEAVIQANLRKVGAAIAGCLAGEDAES